MIKGYTGFVGQALTAIKACELAAEHLREYEIVIYSASLKSRFRALKLRHLHGIKVTILKKRTPHNQMLKHFSEARIYIGISLSDGISTSLLEAMATGCYPIQTNTSCAAEWTNEHSGSLVSSNDPVLLSEILKEVLSNDQLVDDARIKNLATIEARGAVSVIKHQSRSFYEII
jgi:glycosyltransferase involved in cell wall biosynthesis